MEQLWPQLGSFGVSVGTRLQFTNVPQNNPNGDRGCGKAHPLPRAPLSHQKKPWQDRGSWDPSFLLLLFLVFFIAFKSPGQKLVKLITQGSVKIKVKVPAPCMPLSLPYEVCRFSGVLSSFPLFFVQ